MNSRNKMHADSIAMKAYDKMAKYYADFVDTKAYNAYYERPATLSLLPDVHGLSVLDVGCAGGWYTKWLVDHGAKVTAIDLNEKMVEATRQRVGENAEIIQSDLNNPLDFIDDLSFDIVLASLVLHYLKDWTLFLKEACRVLKDNGLLVFSTHHPFADYALSCSRNYFQKELLNDSWLMDKEMVDVQFYRRPLSEIIQPVIDQGFSIEKILEPMPTEEFKNQLPDDYDRLCKQPQFLFVRARKQI